MSNIFSRRILIPADVLIREIEGEAVILSLKNDSYFGLNKTGTRILSVLGKSESVEKGLEVLLTEFDVDEQTLRKDIEALLQDLLQQGLVEYADE